MGGWVGGVRMDVNEELNFLRKFKQKNGGGRVGGFQVEGVFGLSGCSGWGGGSGGCERRIEVFVKIHKKWGGRVGGSGWM